MGQVIVTLWLSHSLCLLICKKKGVDYRISSCLPSTIIALFIIRNYLKFSTNIF